MTSPPPSRTVVLAYPLLPAPDAGWIEGIRAEHDPQARTVAAHVTLVFPLDFHPHAVALHARDVLRGERAFDAVLEDAVVVKEGDIARVFLLPGDGAGDLRRLHDRLYTGPLAPALRSDVPYVPHITVAASHDQSAMQRLAEAVRERATGMRGRIEALDVAAFDGSAVRTVERISLA